MTDPSALLDPVRGYLAEPRFAVLSTNGPDGVPHPAVVHYRLERDALVVNGRADRRWISNLRRDPRVSVVVHDADRPSYWVGIKGSVELLRTGQAAVDDATALARRYEDPAVFEGQQRVSYRILPRRVYEYG
jgi:PPOX class probable F420-dependent enzyme